jgi:hypothetical protein
MATPRAVTMDGAGGFGGGSWFAPGVHGREQGVCDVLRDHELAATPTRYRA